MTLHQTPYTGAHVPIDWQPPRRRVSDAGLYKISGLLLAAMAVVYGAWVVL